MCTAPQIPPGKLTEKARTVALLRLRNPERRAIGFDKAVECVALHETDEVEVAAFIAEWIRKAREMRDEGFRLHLSLMRKVQEAMRPARFPPAEAKAGHSEAVAAYRKLPTARLGVVGPRELGPQLEPLDPVDENYRRRGGAHEKGDKCSIMSAAMSSRLPGDRSRQGDLNP